MDAYGREIAVDAICKSDALYGPWLQMIQLVREEAGQGIHRNVGRDILLRDAHHTVDIGSAFDRSQLVDDGFDDLGLRFLTPLGAPAFSLAVTA